MLLCQDSRESNRPTIGEVTTLALPKPRQVRFSTAPVPFNLHIQFLRILVSSRMPGQKKI